MNRQRHYLREQKAGSQIPVRWCSAGLIAAHSRYPLGHRAWAMAAASVALDGQVLL
jgi:hypothetical protein